MAFSRSPALAALLMCAMIVGSSARGFPGRKLQQNNNGNILTWLAGLAMRTIPVGVTPYLSVTRSSVIPPVYNPETNQWNLLGILGADAQSQSYARSLPIGFNAPEITNVADSTAGRPVALIPGAGVAGGIGGGIAWTTLDGRTHQLGTNTVGLGNIGNSEGDAAISNDGPKGSEVDVNGGPGFNFYVENDILGEWGCGTSEGCKFGFLTGHNDK